ncbi:MAG TPA: PhoH family protein [Thermoanaerobaculia bacterium]|jgi:PhoH-like ATPase|nr:PhoH family protein [Thermoanaerobaculia bacterium]
MPRTQRKIFVLDTSVILYDFNAIHNFQEHDVAIPITVLEELDTFKKGNSVLNLQAREFIRQLDKLAGHGMLADWIPLDGAARGKFRVLTDENAPVDAAEVFGTKKADHRILNAALSLARAEPDRKVVLVSKDINLRLKARALKLPAEDYETVKIKDLDHLYKGKSEIELPDPEIIDRLYREESVPVEEMFPTSDRPTSNHYFILRSQGRSGLGYYNPRTERVERIIKPLAYGVSPRNAEQTFALHAVLNPQIPLVTLSGAAGTGKTLLALAGALEQRRDFRQIYLARPIVPLSNRDIGFLPGDILSKINPFMQPLWDNLGIIKNQFGEREREYKKVDELVETEKLHIVPLAYIRGRSLSNVIFIVDEAQNLTPHEVKTIITRAGEKTKVILTGDIFQIDTPYLDAHSNGLSYLIDRLRGNALYSHVNLEKGERSELANLASSLL